MNIRKLTLISYGKFKNKSFEFNNGFNVFYGENGSGKSTIATALKTFLYKNIKGNRKYKKNCIPLDGNSGVFEVEFEARKNSVYESSVVLGQTASRSDVTTVEKPLNSRVACGDAEIGEYFLETSEDMYDSVCHIRDTEDFYKVTSNGEIVGENISGEICSGKGKADISAAVEALREEINAITRKTSSGRIYPLKEELAEINSKLIRAEEIMTEETRLTDASAQLELKANELKGKITALEENKRIYEEYSEYRKYISLCERKQKLEEMKKEYSVIKTDFEEMSAEEEKRMLALEIISAKESKSNRNGFVLIAFIFAALILAIAGFFNKIFFYLSAICAAYGIILMKKNAKEMRERANYEADLKEYKRICEKYNVSGFEEYAEARKKAYENKAHAKSILEKTEKEESLIRELAYSVKVFEKEPEKPEIICDFDSLIKSSETELSGILRELAVLKERIDNLFNNFPEYDALLKRSEELKEKIAGFEYELEITTAALDIMEITSSSYKESYLPGLIELTAEILADSGVVSAEKIVIDEKMNISIREQGELFLKDNSHLSSGISDSVHFALKLAIIQLAFSKKEKPVIILDDPFIRMDDKIFSEWVCYLKEKFPFQTVFFTARKKIFEIILEKDTINIL